jgi:hypothetical protein
MHIFTQWPDFASKLYRQRDRRLPAKLVTNFGDGGYRVVSLMDPYGRILGSLNQSRLFFFQVAPQVHSRG